MSRTTWSWIVYGIWLAYFLSLELPAVFRLTPWNTLSTTAWNLENQWRWLALVFAGGLFVLTLHIAFRWPERIPS